MTAQIMVALLSVVTFLVLCSPPGLAVWMLFTRLRVARPEWRPVYLLLSVAAVLLLLFNALVSFGVTGPIRAMAPPLLSDRPGLTALLFAWIAAGLCVLLQVVDPQRQRDTQF